MNILVLNDDGIDAPGLWVMVSELKHVGQVTVVAPQKEQSGVGSSITFRRVVAVEKEPSPIGGVDAYSVTGTPADCAIIAIKSLLPDSIDIAISGINRGPNLGHDVFVSGTFGAALQTHLHGIPSMAVSLDAYENMDFAVSARVTALLAESMGNNIIGGECLLNVNVPHIPLEEIQGMDVTSLSRQNYCGARVEGDDGHYHITRLGDMGEGLIYSDLWALRQHRISVTPLLFTHDNSPSICHHDGLHGAVPLLFHQLKRQNGAVRDD